ncbi:MAG: hypothetical protein HYT07_03590 [Candidatus Levybacteria bacterium]|nr:hypothetical protein [Candidatus Levybacteria bacterium]
MKQELLNQTLTSPPQTPYSRDGAIFMEVVKDMPNSANQPKNPERTENRPLDKVRVEVNNTSKKEETSSKSPQSVSEEKKGSPVEAKITKVDSKKIDNEELRKEWHKVFTPEELKNPDTRSTIELAIKLGYSPESITSKGPLEFKAKDVIANALLDDQQRIEKAEELLGRSLSIKQRELLLKAHYASKGKTGKDGRGAGVFNLERKQLAEEARILSNEEGFTDKERRILIEAGLAATLIPNIYTDPTLQLIAEQYINEVNRINATNPSEHVDPNFLIRLMTDVERRARDGLVDRTQALNLLNEFQTIFADENPAQGESPLTREINLIKGLQGQDRRDALLNLLRAYPPLSAPLPHEIIELTMEDDESFESLVNRIVSLPLDKETSDYTLGLYGSGNLETISDALTQKLDTETDPDERDRLSRLKDRFNLATESFTLTHNMNTRIVTGEIQEFIRTAERILPPHLNYLQKLNGVSEAMRIYEETYDRYLAKYGWMYPFASVLLHYEVFSKLRELNDAGGLGVAKAMDGELRLIKLEEWELRRAYNIARKFYNNTFRSSEKVATGTVPRNMEGEERQEILAEIQDAIDSGNTNKEALLRNELADAEERGQSRYSSFALESAARIMNPIQLLIYRFQIAGEEHGLVFLKKAKEYYLEFLRHNYKLGINKITTLGGVNVEEMEVGGVFGVSGFYSSWRTENIAISQMKVNIGGQELTIRRWLAETTYEIEQANTAFKDAGQNRQLKHNAQVQLADALKPLIDNVHVGLGMLLRQPAFGGEIGYEARKLLWEKIVKGNDPANNNPREGNLDVAINYLTKLKIQDGSIRSLEEIKSSGGNYWDVPSGDPLTTPWEILRRKILLQHQKNIRKSFDTNVNLIPDQDFDANETRLILTIKEEGRKLAQHLADISFPYVPFMNDAPFEIFDYTLAGDEVYRRRAGGDIPSYFEGSNAFVAIVDNPGGIGDEKAMENFLKLERGVESPQGRPDAQRRTYPLFKAWLEWVMTKPGQRQEQFKAIKQTLLHPTSEAQEHSGMEAMSINEEQARKFIDHAVLANFLNEELADELKKEKNLKFVGMLWALFRDMFITVIPAAVVYSFGKEVLKTK